MVKFIPWITKNLERIAAKSSSLYRTILPYYKNLVKNEIALANIKSADKVLCIGGGPCPISGILLHEYTGASVTIIDNDNCCVRISRELVKTLGYENSIKILLSNGSDISPEDYSVIHLAVQVSPMDQVFGHLMRKCSIGAKILVRLPKKRLNNLYSIKDSAVFDNCSAKVMHNWRNIESTALFVR